MPERIVDLRSDTLTQPTDEMRDAMRSAPVGDDVYGEDPTVNDLEAFSAKALGKEAALFCPSGTMANEIAIFVHARRPGEIVVERESHIVLYETGGPALLSGVMVRTLEGRRGVFTARQLAEAIRLDEAHEPPTVLVSIENTHNIAGGSVWTQAQTVGVAEVAAAHRVPLHIDGARLFNSAVAQDTTAARLAAPADTVMVSLSKGLSAPVGSVLAGPRPIMDKARRVRKLLGGGMRQAGTIAAAGRIGLERMVGRLKEDHANARRLAVGLAKVPGLQVDLDAAQTNIVMLDVAGTNEKAPQLAERLVRSGVRCIGLDDRRIRFVTHRHVSRDDVDWALAQIAEVLRARKPVKKPQRR